MSTELEKIREIVSKALKVDISQINSLSDNVDLRKHRLDSLNSIDMIVLIEDEFNIEVKDSDLMIKNFNTIEKIKSLVERLVYAGKT